MKERWVDGFNVMHLLPELVARLESDPEGARRRFLRLLAPLVFRSGERWTVVFDGPRGGRAKAPGPIDVIYAPHADSWIVEALERHRHPDAVTVVSSDEKDIGRRARALGASVQSAASLLRALAGDDAPPEPAEPEKPDSVSPEEVDFWLDAFGGGASGEPKRRFDTLKGDDPDPES
ncbi:MAG: NYN domain-containing protein [Candidatus Krumholzibacteriia bacterium]|nr:NYN domain-containing protein [bacterium]MCB9515313.1 NYN domain-containing protein [Candidatus Latescibacterota bacterium]